MNINKTNKDLIQVDDIDSTNVSKLEYVKKQQELKVVYHHGGKYLYKEVTKKEFNHIIEADSIGKAVREVCIITNKPFTKL